MSIYEQRVILWPFALDGTNNTVNFEDTGGAPAPQALTQTRYLTSGDGVLTTPVDILEEFTTAMNAAAAVLGLAGTFSASRNADGTCSLIRTGGASPADNLIIKWGSGTFDPDILGFDGVATTTVSFLPSTGPFLMDYQWMPGKPHIHDDPEAYRNLATEDENLIGRPSVVEQSASAFFMRQIDWERIFSARMHQARANDAAFATPAGLPVGDDTTWERMYRYLVGPSIPGINNDVFVLNTNLSPVAADRTGPYRVKLSKSNPGLGGIGPATYARGTAAEQYDVTLLFWTD